MHAPLSTSAAVPVWGVLVSQNTPTSENGLLPFAVERYASRTCDVAAEATTTTTTTRRTPAAGPVWASEGDAWLWAQLPPALRLQHYPALEQSATPLRSTTATTTGVEAQTKAALMDEEAEYAQLRLLLPLCRAGQGSVTVGRLLSNDFSLPTNPCISSVHCSLSYQPSSTRRVEKNSSPHPHRSAASPTTSAGAGAGGGGGGGVVVADGPEMREARAAVDRAVAQHHGLPSMSLHGTHAHREAESDAEKGETEGGEENTKNGKEGQRAAVATKEEEEEAAAHILLSDYSTNGCSVNGHFVGKGKSARLYNGDLVELINAGPRHTTDYNLAFRFFTVSGFLRWAAAAASATQATGDTDTTSETQTQQGKGKKGGGEKEEAKEVQGTQRQQQQQLKKQQQREQQTAARRRALLCKAQWNVEAQVRRMYHHRVDEFYDLDRAKPLGQGTFGVVYRASLRADAAAGANAKAAASASAATTTAPPPSTLREVAAAVFAQAGVGSQAAAVAAAYSHNTDVASALEHQLFSTAAACVWTAAPEAEKRLAEAYVREKEVRAPTTVLRAVSSSSSSSTAVAGAPCLFAVKIVRKQRMLLDVLHQQQQEQQQQQKQQDADASMRGEMTDGHANTPAPAATVTSGLSKAEAALLQQLVQLETQPDDLAEQRREEWTAGALASLQLADSVLSPSQQHQQASTSLERLLSTFSNYTQEREKEDEEEHSNTTEGPASHGAVAAAAAVGSVAAVAHKQQQRELQRVQLLRCLPDALRKAYEKELQHRRRQQCEINILLAVRHPNVTTLYEVFDQPDQLALVMEQATGGEVWDLLQPYQRRCRRGPAAKHVRGDGDGNNAEGPRVPSASGSANSTTAAKKEEEEEEEEMAAYDDVDLTSTGGPLPEYVVKLIIVQVLEAVLYLHTMGIIHRDLKLENLMLHRPCDRYALNALQLQVLLQQLRNYEKQDGQAAQPGPPTSSSPPSPSASASADSPLSGTLMAETEFSNPLSPLHTVHIPRSMWPVVKVTDFGLSRVLDQLQTRPHTNSSGDGDGVLQTLHGLTAADGGLRGDADKNKAVPERVKLIYSRNDATTSCGTPIYAAPEVTMSGLRPNKVGYGAAVDMYSVGVIAFALLTGRAPFPSRRSAHRPNGPPVIDYDAPLTFYRHRRRPASKSDPSPSTHQQLRRPPAPTVDDPAVRLPELSTAEYVRVPITAELRAATDNSSSRNKSSTSGGASASLSASAHAQRWHARTAALANRIRLAEGGTGSASAAPFFATTVRRLCESLSTYASGCAARGEEVDIDRLVSVSAANEQAAAAEAVNGRVRGADGVVTGVVLPPISALGAAFLRGLLEKYPSQRLTAYEALRHPWLRECVDLPPTS